MKVRSILWRLIPVGILILMLGLGLVCEARARHFRRSLILIADALSSGWLPSAQRFGKSLHLDWADMAAWLATALVALWLLHSMVRWLLNGSRPWRMRSTAIVMVLLGVNLLFAMSAVGIAHQTGWWLASNEAKWKNSGEIDTDEFDAVDAQIEVTSLARQPEPMPASELRAAIYRNLARVTESLFITVFQDEQGVATGVLITPRDPGSRSRIGYALLDIQRERTSNGASEPIDGWITVPDVEKLSPELQKLNVDPTPFLERWRTNLPAHRPISGSY